MKIDPSQTIINLTYQVGLITSTPALLQTVVDEFKLQTVQRPHNQFGPITVYSNISFSFYILPQAQTITFEILGKDSCVEYLEDIKKVMAKLQFISPGNRALGIVWSGIIDITDEFPIIQKILENIDTEIIAQKFNVKEVQLGGLKLQGKRENCEFDMLFQLKSPKFASCVIQGRFTKSEEFGSFINKLNGKYIEEMWNGIIKNN